MTATTVGAATRVQGLDGLRALAVAAVLVLHATAFLTNSHPLPGGWLGVDLFFVLSGYLITSLLVEQVRRPEGMRRFYWRRAKRLLPPLAAMLVVVGIGDHFDWLGDSRWTDFSVTALASLAWAVNWFDLHGLIVHDYLVHLWSLAVEGQFYVVWPLAVWAVRDRLLAFTVGCVALVVVWRALVFEWDWFAAYTRTDTRTDALLIGACLALSPRLRGFLARFAWVGLAVWIVGLLYVEADRVELYDRAWLTGFALACAAMVAGVIERRWCSRVLEARPVVTLGVVSYAVYLWHYPIMRFVQLQLGWSGPVAIVVALALTAAATAGSWWLVEGGLRRRAQLRRREVAVDRGVQRGPLVVEPQELHVVTVGGLH